MVKTALTGIVCAMLPIASAAAAPATADEASRLTTLFQRFVGAPAAGQPSAVTVSPDGDSYRVALDLKQALKGLEGLGVTVDPSQSVTELTPLTDGTWKVSNSAAPPLTIHLRDQSISIKAAKTLFDGIYDPRIFAFASMTGQYSGYDSTSTSPSAVQNTHTDTIGITGTGAPAAGGTATVNLHETAAGSRVDILTKSPGAPSASPAAPDAATPAPAVMAFGYTAPNASLDLGFERFHTKELLDLWAFLVAHPNRDSLAAAQDDLRPVLRALLPLAANITETAKVDTLALTTPAGPFTARTAAAGGHFTKLDGVATLATSLSIGGLTVPADQLPPWSRGLVPTDISLDIGADGFHLAEAATEAINDFDLKSDRPFTPDQQTRIGHAALPGVATVTLRPSRLASALLDLSLEGSATLGDVPDGHLDIKAVGLDKAIASLQSASTADPSAAQALGPLVLAKNLAKPGPDGSLVWVVAFKGGGPVTVNGTPMQ